MSAKSEKKSVKKSSVPGAKKESRSIGNVSNSSRRSDSNKVAEICGKIGKALEKCGQDFPVYYLYKNGRYKFGDSLVSAKLEGEEVFVRSKGSDKWMDLHTFIDNAAQKWSVRHSQKCDFLKLIEAVVNKASSSCTCDFLQLSKSSVTAIVRNHETYAYSIGSAVLPPLDIVEGEVVLKNTKKTLEDYIQEIDPCRNPVKEVQEIEHKKKKKKPRKPKSDSRDKKIVTPIKYEFRRGSRIDPQTDAMKSHVCGETCECDCSFTHTETTTTSFMSMDNSDIVDNAGLRPESSDFSMSNSDPVEPDGPGTASANTSTNSVVVKFNSPINTGPVHSDELYGAICLNPIRRASSDNPECKKCERLGNILRSTEEQIQDVYHKIDVMLKGIPETTAEINGNNEIGNYQSILESLRKCKDSLQQQQTGIAKATQ